MGACCCCCAGEPSVDELYARIVENEVTATSRDGKSEVSALENKLDAVISDYRLFEGNGDRHVMYEIQISKKGEVLWTVNRRYNDFCDLLLELRYNVNAKRLPKLPGRKLFGNFDPAFIEKRMGHLNKMLKIMLNDGVVVQDSAFRSFLRDGKQVNKDVVMSPLLRVEDFELLAVLGKGSYAKVLQVRKKDNGKIYALKILQKQHLVARNVVANAIAERKILAGLDHPFVVSLHYAFQSHDKLYLVVDYFNGGELFYHLRKEGRFSESRARFYLSEVVLAVEHLHRNGIIYRDLKPENILLDDSGHIRLTDFGLSKDGLAQGVLTRTFCGTPSYASPEMLTRSPYDKTVDWWSVGVLLYEMLTGLPPFRHRNTRVMFDHILHAQPSFPDYISADAKSIINGLLQKDPRRRLGYRSAKGIKRHAFFQGVDWELVYKKQVPVLFKPQIDPKRGQLDLTNISNEFKIQVAADTPSNLAPTLNTRMAFPNFTYDEQDPFLVDQAAYSHASTSQVNPPSSFLGSVGDRSLRKKKKKSKRGKNRDPVSPTSTADAKASFSPSSMASEVGSNQKTSYVGPSASSLSFSKSQGGMSPQTRKATSKKLKVNRALKYSHDSSKSSSSTRTSAAASNLFADNTDSNMGLHGSEINYSPIE